MKIETGRQFTAKTQWGETLSWSLLKVSDLHELRIVLPARLKQFTILIADEEDLFCSFFEILNRLHRGEMVV